MNTSKAVHFIQKNWLIICLLALSAYLSLYRIDDCAVWMDEFFSLRIAQQDLAKIWSLETGHRNFYFSSSPPLYETILHFFWNPYRNDCLLARSVSIVFNLFALYFIFSIAKLLFDRETGIVAMFLATVNHAFIFYSKMIRGYAFLNALSIFSFYLFFKILKEQKTNNKHLVLLTLCNAAILYTAYFGVFVLITELILMLLFIPRQLQKKIWQCLVLPIVFFLPWTGHFIKDIMKESAFAINPHIGGEGSFFYIFFNRFSTGIFNNPMLCMVFIFIVIYLILSKIKLLCSKCPQSLPIACLMIILIVPVVIINFITKAVEYDYSRARYSLAYVFPLFILSGFFVTKTAKILGRAVFIVLIVLSVVTLDRYYKAPIDEFWPAQLALITQEIKNLPIAEDDKVIVEVEAAMFIRLVEHYFSGNSNNFKEFAMVPKYQVDGRYFYLRDLDRLPQGKGDGRYRFDTSRDKRYTFYCSILGREEYHWIGSIPAFVNADWLVLIYSNWFEGEWVKYYGKLYRAIYQDKLRQYNLQNAITLVHKKDFGGFVLEIYKVKKLHNDIIADYRTIPSGS